MEWIILLILIIIGHIGLYGIFKKQDIPAWKAFVPVMGKMEWMKMLGYPTWRVALLFIPIVNFFIYAGLFVTTANSFGKFTFKDHFLAVAFAPFYLCYLGFSKAVKWVSPGETDFQAYKENLMAVQKSGDKYKLEKLRKSPYHKPAWREWSEAIIFAVFAATFIRMFLIEAYTIPTPSMEGSLMTGDFLFVSKMSYGMRMPNTPLQLPLLHNRIPKSEKESYSRAIEWPHRRLGSTSGIKVNDPVVFNFPEGDTIVLHKTNKFKSLLGGRYDYGHILAGGSVTRKQLHDPNLFELVYRPVDRRDHYIKRCLAVAGDELQIVDGQVKVNGKDLENPDNMQFLYKVVTDGQPESKITRKALLDLGVHADDINARHNNTPGLNQKLLHINKESAEYLRTRRGVLDVSRVLNGDIIAELNKLGAGYENKKKDLFPRGIKNGWTLDNFGPVKIPARGATVNISPANIEMYRRVIDVYEGNDLEIKNGKIYINGKESSQYTFKMNYYWMMGDNRHNSEDSRYWGFVPEDHIVGKPLFIWFSLKNAQMSGETGGVRWDRLFSSAYKFKD